PEPEYYWYIFKQGKNSKEYNVTFRIEKYTIKRSHNHYKFNEKLFNKSCEKYGLNNTINWHKLRETTNAFVFLINIENIEIIECNNKNSDKVILGVMVSNLKSFIRNVTEEVESFQCEAIVFRLKHNNGHNGHTHEIVMVISFGRCKSKK
ncbi:MAG: hypothetical protein ACFFAU_13150, partial [Candidatus Hodarchaeota archaeon]